MKIGFLRWGGIHRLLSFYGEKSYPRNKKSKTMSKSQSAQERAVWIRSDKERLGEIDRVGLQKAKSIKNLSI